MGGGGWTIVDYKSNLPKLKKNVARDEQCQADLLVELIELYNNHNLYCCSVFDFLEGPSRIYFPLYSKVF